MKKIFLVLLLSLGCVKQYTRETNTQNPLGPSENNSESKIEFRVNGNPTSVRVRFSNAEDGLSQVVTTLPYVTTITTKESSLFVSLEVTPVSYSALTVFPFLSVQIFGNGVLFREATTNEFLLNTLSVSGTWRR